MRILKNKRNRNRSLGNRQVLYVQCLRIKKIQHAFFNNFFLIKIDIVLNKLNLNTQPPIGYAGEEG